MKETIFTTRQGKEGDESAARDVVVKPTMNNSAMNLESLFEGSA